MHAGKDNATMVTTANAVNGSIPHETNSVDVTATKIGPTSILVVVALLTYVLAQLWRSWVESNQQRSFAAQHGCQPIKTVFSGRLPYGLDTVRGLYRANAGEKLMSYLWEIFQPCIEKDGPNLELRLLGNAGLVTVDQETIKAVLSKSPIRDGELDWGFGQRRQALLPLFGDGIFTQEGHAWKHSREMLRRQFARIQFQNIDIFTDHVELLISRLSRMTGDTVDLQPLFFNFTLDTSTSLLFGESANSLCEDAEDELGTSLNDASWFSAIRVQLAYLYWICSPPQYYRSCQKVKKYTDRWVQKALDAPNDQDGESGDSGQYTFIRNLYDELKDRNLVREQLVNVLLAGRDTTACLLSWTFRLLVRHEDALNRLRDEIESVQGSDPYITKATLQRMPYLKCVLNETLRLYPPVPVNFRETNHLTVLPHGGGSNGMAPIAVKKQTGIGMSAYHMHRRKDLYGEDAFVFRPERWEDGTLEKTIGYGYLPFNGGPRMCLGREFALLEASYAVLRIVQAFPKLSLPAGEKVEPIGAERQIITLTMAPADGCRVRLC